jgi:hypothetical protein
MDAGLGDAPRKHLSKFIKVTELDFKILILERNPKLSIKEKERLGSLKEQKMLQSSSSMGLNNLKTARVPSEWITGKIEEKSNKSSGLKERQV